MEEAIRRKLRSSTDSVSRLASERSEVASALDATRVKDHVQRAAKPSSLAGGMKRAGVALMVTPDPFTDVAGVALLAGSLAMKRKEPAGLEHLAAETRKLMKELQASRL